MQTVFNMIAEFLTWAFVIGAVGCAVVIPVVAYRLFAVLFEKDLPTEL